MKARNLNMLKKGDVILALAVIAMAIGGFAAYRLYGAGDGHIMAVIKQENRVIRMIELNTVEKPEKIIINGDYSNTVLVEKGRVRFEEATCPDKICVRTGWLSRKGSSAVCIPNHAIIKIEGVNEQVDGGTY
jgi:hypothetical protein